MTQMTEAGRQLLRQYILKNGHSLGTVSKALDHHRTWLPKVLNGDLQLTIDHVEAILDQIGIPVADFLADWISHLDTGLPLTTDGVAYQRPEQILRGMLKCKPERTICSLPRLDRWLERTQIPPDPGAMFSLDRRVQEIDDLREHDAGAALAEAELWLDQLFDRHAQRRLEPLEASKVSSALGVWASCCRVRGQLFLASQILLEAFTIHGRATSSPTYGDLLERLALLLRDSGYTTWSLGPIRQAYAIFALSENGRREARSLLALGILQTYLGHSEQAELALTRCLKHKDADPIRKASAAINLAVGFEKQGRLKKASAILRLIEPNQELLPHNWRSSLFGVRGRLLQKLGAPNEAYHFLRLAMGSSRRLAPCSQFLLLLDYFSILLELGKIQELRELAVSHAVLLAKLEDNPLARGVAQEFIKLVRSELEITAEDVTQAAREFTRAMRCDRKRR